MRNRFEEYIIARQQRGPIPADELVQILLPLFEEVATFHEAGQVAPLHNFDTLLVTRGCLDIDEEFAREPQTAIEALRALQPTPGTAPTINITGETTVVADVDTGMETELISSAAGITAEELLAGGAPLHLPHYRSYETLVGHHDAVTDIYLLGLVAASVATGLNFYEERDFQTFIRARQALPGIAPGLHPALAAVIEEMTELDRHRRARDLTEVIRKMAAYRDYNPEAAVDLTQLSAIKNAPAADRQTLVLRKLRSRLFDTGRRNRLLYFKSNMRFLNLTVSSFPLRMNLQHVKSDHLFYWNDSVRDSVVKKGKLHLNKFLRPEDNPYINISLDKIRLETAHDINEYGMSQLRLAVAFLHWYNLKEDGKERISSPFILLPATLEKTKALRADDDFSLALAGTEAEVNPILRYTLEEAYGIKLPERIDLAETDLVQFFEELKRAVEGTGHGIRIALVDKPRIKLLHTVAVRTATVYAKRSRTRSRGMAAYNTLDYSYAPDNFQPLGLKIFQT